MAEFTRDASAEYWRPVTAGGASFQKYSLQAVREAEYCTICGAQYSAGARFCSQCGLNRETPSATTTWNSFAKWSPLIGWVDLDGIRERTGLSTISLALAVLAGICLLATLMTGLLYNTTTLAEWQAVQTWRVEWLLASVAALLGAILFKK